MPVRRSRFQNRSRLVMARSVAVLFIAVTLIGLPGRGDLTASGPVWSSEQQLSDDSRTASDLVSALSDDGTTAVAAWKRSDGANNRIEVATASIGVGGATWSTPVAISPAGGSAQMPAVAISADGSTILLVWDRYDGSRNRVQAVIGTVTNGAAIWSSVSDLSAAGFNGRFVDAALDGAGSLAFVTWRRYNGTNDLVETVTGTISGGTATWGTPAFVSDAGTTTYLPDAAMARDGGSAGVVWGTNLVHGVTATTSGLATSFGTPVTLSATGGNAEDQSLEIENGVAIAIWRRNDGSNWILQTRSATIGAGTPTWEPVENLSNSGQNASHPAVDMSTDASTAVVAWARSNGTHNIVQVRTATVSAAAMTWGSTTDLSAVGESASNTDVAISANGERAAVIWDRPDGRGATRIQVALADIAAGQASWDAAVDLSTAGENATDPIVSMSADGGIALAVWTSENGGVHSVRSRVLAPPAPIVIPPPPLVIPPPVQTAELSDDPTAISSLVTQASTVFIAAAESSIDMALAASAGGHVAGPVLIASSQQLPAATVAEIERLQPERLVLIGGSQRLDEVIDESLIARFPDVRVDRTAGADRVATAVAVSQRFHPSGASRVMLVASDADADAVVAAAQRSPLLLTFARFAPEATLAEIQRLNPGRITIVGGSARVDELVVEQLRVRFPGVLIEQVGGSDRYETAARLSAVGTSRVLIIDGRLEQSELFTAAAVAGMGNRTLLFGRPECSPDVNRPFYVNRSVTSIGRLGVGSCG